MPIQVKCPACGKALRVPDNLIGRNVKCPSCTETFVAAGEGEPAPAPPPPPSATPRRESIRATDDVPLRRRSDEDDAGADDAYRASDDEPPRRSRPRREEFDDDDDFDDRPRRRRRRGMSPDAARDRVSSSANGLIAVGVIGIILGILVIGLGIVLLANPAAMGGGGPGGGPFAGGDEADAIQNIVGGFFNIVISVVILIGATKMKNLQSYGLAKAAAIIALVPCISPCCILGIPFGIMALNALNDPDVKDAFS